MCVLQSFESPFTEVLITRLLAQPKDGTSKLVNDASYRRMESLLSASKGKVVLGGEKDEANRWMGVTVVGGVAGDDSLMES